MQSEQYEAYGERLPGEQSTGRLAVSAIGRTGLIRIGQGVFWLLVLAIVLIRAGCFSAGQTAGFPALETPPQAITR